MPLCSVLQSSYSMSIKVWWLKITITVTGQNHNMRQNHRLLAVPPFFYPHERKHRNGGMEWTRRGWVRERRNIGKPWYNKLLLVAHNIFGPNQTIDCTGLWIEKSGFEPWPGSLCCVLEQDALLTQCLIPSSLVPLGTSKLWGQRHKVLGVTCNGLLGIPSRGSSNNNNLSKSLHAMETGVAGQPE